MNVWADVITRLLVVAGLAYLLVIAGSLIADRLGAPRARVYTCDECHGGGGYYVAGQWEVCELCGGSGEYDDWDLAYSELLDESDEVG